MIITMMVTMMITLTDENFTSIKFYFRFDPGAMTTCKDIRHNKLYVLLIPSIS